MNFLPLLLMMNGMNKEKREDASVDAMIKELSRVKAFEDIQKKSGPEQMETLASLMADDNPQMKNMMSMVRMMSAMNQSSGGGDKESGEPPGETRAQSYEEDPEEPAPPVRETAGTPLKPISKIANRDITYLLNRYINR